MAKKTEKKVQEQKVAEPVNPTEPVKVAKTEADLIWDTIKSVNISLFGLPPKKLEEYAERINVVPDKVHLSLKGPTALISTIEESLNTFRDGFGGEKRFNRFEVEQTQNGMLVISKVTLSK